MRQSASSCLMFLASLRRLTLVLILSLLLPGAVCDLMAIAQERYVETSHRPGGFTLADHNHLAAIYVDDNDYWGVVRAAHDLQQDISRVSGRTPDITKPKGGLAGNETAKNGIIIIGTLGKSALV